MKHIQDRAFKTGGFIIGHVKRHPLAVGMALLCWFLVASLWELAEDVFEGDSREIDTMILHKLRAPGDLNDPLGPRWLEEIMRDFTALGGIAILTLLVVAAFFYMVMVRKRREGIFLLCAIGTGTVITNLLKAGFDRPRPELIPSDAIVYTASFPSGHAMMAALVYLTLGALLAQTQSNYRLKSYILALCIFITLLVGVSRIYLGVHWPSDVLAGWLGGTAWALLCWLALYYFRVFRKN